MRSDLSLPSDSVRQCPSLCDARIVCYFAALPATVGQGSNKPSVVGPVVALRSLFLRYLPIQPASETEPLHPTAFVSDEVGAVGERLAAVVDGLHVVVVVEGERGYPAVGTSMGFASAPRKRIRSRPWWAAVSCASKHDRVLCGPAIRIYVKRVQWRGWVCRDLPHGLVARNGDAEVGVAGTRIRRHALLRQHPIEALPTRPSVQREIKFRRILRLRERPADLTSAAHLSEEVDLGGLRPLGDAVAPGFFRRARSAGGPPGSSRRNGFLSWRSPSNRLASSAWRWSRPATSAAPTVPFFELQQAAGDRHLPDIELLADAADAGANHDQPGLRRPKPAVGGLVGSAIQQRSRWSTSDKASRRNQRWRGPISASMPSPCSC